MGKYREISQVLYFVFIDLEKTFDENFAKQYIDEEYIDQIIVDETTSLI